jgi:hypothetical protein
MWKQSRPGWSAGFFGPSEVTVESVMQGERVVGYCRTIPYGIELDASYAGLLNAVPDMHGKGMVVVWVKPAEYNLCVFPAVFVYQGVERFYIVYGSFPDGRYHLYHSDAVFIWAIFKKPCTSQEWAEILPAGVRKHCRDCFNFLKQYLTRLQTGVPLQGLLRQL